jgi:hypothetical protein
MANDKTTKRAPGLKFEYTHSGCVKFSAAGIGEHVFNPTDASLECRFANELKGWKGSIEDAAAKSRDPVTGESASLAERFAACVEIATYYANKNVTVWGRKAAATPRDDTGLTLMALMRVWACDVDKANGYIGKLAAKAGIERDAQLKALGQSPDVIKAVSAIKAERAAAASKANAADMLAALKDAGDEPDDEEDDDEAPM